MNAPLLILDWLRRGLRRLEAHAFGSERGAVAVLFAVIMVPLVAVSALSVDTANLFLDRREQQNAADAASLAAASYLPSTNVAVLNTATNAAIAYAALNGVTITAADVWFTTASEPNDVVHVRTNRSVPFFFAKALGISTGAVSSRSASQLGSLVGMAGVMPWGLQQQNFSFNTQYCLKMGPNGNGGQCNSQSGQGDFGPIDIDNHGSASGQVYDDLIITGSQTLVQVGQIKGTVSGNKQGPTLSALGCSNNSTGRLTGNTDTFAKVVSTSEASADLVLDWYSPRVVIIPVISIPGNNLVRIDGFVVFFITACGQNGSVIGHFIDPVVPGGQWGTYQPGFGARVVRIVE